MIGNHGYEVILDGYVKGIVSNDLAAVAYEAMKEEVHVHKLNTDIIQKSPLSHITFHDHLGHQD